MRRALIIATREYLSFLRTPGFWISLLVMPLVGLLTGLGPQMIARSEPPASIAVIDLTGLGPSGPGPWLVKALGDAAAGPQGAQHKRVVVVPTPEALTRQQTPEATGTALRAYMAAQTPLPPRSPGEDARPLSAAAVISGSPAQLKVDLWTPAPQVAGLQRVISEPLDAWARRARLTAAGLDPAVADRLDQNLTDVRDFSPKAATGRVSLSDRLPVLAAVGLSFMLWALVLTGAGILLNTVIEEKSNRVIEVLLSSASVTEILAGKIAGGGALSLTMMGFWGAIAFSLMQRSSPDLVAQVVAALMAHGLIFWFAAFFLSGYLMYASIFAAVGSFCETPREAQTLLGPIMVLLSVPIIFLGASISAPDAPALKILAWVPFFTPFLMTTRVAAGAPVGELLLALGEMAATTVLVVWLSGRAFRSGALATEKLDPRRFLSAMIGRGK